MPDERRMSSIIMRGGTTHGWVFFDALHGISVFGRGVFKDEHGFNTYAGQHKDGFACGLAVLTRYDGPKVYAELGPDGSYDGRYVSRGVDVYDSYGLYERGKEKAYALVSPDGSCRYNREVCAPDDPRLLALIAQVAPVEVRPAAPAPHLPIAAHAPAIVRCAGSLVLPLQALADAMATEVQPHAARRRWWPAVLHEPTTAATQSATTV